MPRLPAVLRPRTSSEPFAPYLVVRAAPAVYLTIPLPVGADLPTLIARAEAKMAELKHRFKICLVISPNQGLYLQPDGSSFWGSIIPFGGIVIQEAKKDGEGLH